MKKSIIFSYLYSVASVIIGPAIVILSASKHPSGFDCSDSSWDSSGVSIADREALYDHAARFMAPLASVMIIIGLSVLVYLIYNSINSNRRWAAVLPAFLILCMVAGYALIITVASSPWC